MVIILFLLILPCIHYCWQSTIIFLHSPNQINVFWRSSRRCPCPCLSSEGDKGGESEEEDEDEETGEM